MENDTDFDWECAIDRNFGEIERIVMQLFRLAGISSLAPFVATLPRFLYYRILSILRPAEYAARRLIAMAACKLDLDVGPVPVPAAADPSPPRREEDRKAREQGEPAETGGGSKAEQRFPAFKLFDPIKPYGEPWLTPEQIAALSDPDHTRPIIPVRPQDEPVEARALCRRIAALRHALVELDAHALRLARWRARRHLATCRPKRWWPMRPGRPPGWKRRPKTALEQVLAECDFLARDAWTAPDTS